MTVLEIRDVEAALDRLYTLLHRRHAAGKACTCRQDAIDVFDAAAQPRIDAEQRPAGQRVIPAGWTQRGPCVWDDNRRGIRVIATEARQDDGRWWLHVSASRRDRQLPTWAQLVEVKDVFVGAGVEAYKILPPRSRYVNINPGVLHLFHCVDQPDGVLPDFTHGAGSI